jgi:hypothetical protein
VSAPRRAGAVTVGLSPARFRSAKLASPTAAARGGRRPRATRERCIGIASILHADLSAPHSATSASWTNARTPASTSRCSAGRTARVVCHDRERPAARAPGRPLGLCVSVPGSRRDQTPGEDHPAGGRSTADGWGRQEQCRRPAASAEVTEQHREVAPVGLRAYFSCLDGGGGTRPVGHGGHGTTRSSPSRSRRCNCAPCRS